MPLTLPPHHISALLVTGASLLMCLLLFGVWRVSAQPRERFLLLASLAQLVFTLHQIPLFFDATVFANWTWRATFAAMFGLYMGLTALIVNLFFSPPSRLWLRLTKLYLWLVVPLSFYIFGIFDFTGYLSSIYVQHRLTLNNLIALLINVCLALVVVRKFYVMQHQLLQSRMDAEFALERAKLTERQRIMSDIHDTVGSQLVGVLSLVRAQAPYAQLETHTAEALQGLRIAIDAIQPVNGNLAAVLATLRHRLQPSLNAAGVTLVWRVDDLPRLAGLSPQKIQHIQRIVMEAFSNVIQHSGASKVLVRAQLSHGTFDQPHIRICIADNGVGLPAALSAGQGLANMRVRAEAIGAALTWRSVPQALTSRILRAGQLNLAGTSLRLDLPFIPPSPT
jgi:signal transduction histidine kinase